MRMRPNYQTLNGQSGSDMNGMSSATSDEELLDASSEYEAEQSGKAKKHSLFPLPDPDNDDDVGE